MLAQGQTSPLFPALHIFLYLCGFDFDPPEHERRRACFAFTEAVIKALDHQLARHRGEVVPTDVVAPEALRPNQVSAAKTTWEEAFDTWKTEVRNRPDSTVIA